MRGTPARLGIVLLVLAQGASGQDRIDTPQVSVPERRLPLSTPTTRDLTTAQVSPPAPIASGTQQITAERRTPPRPAQLSRGGTAEAPAPLSRPADGRTVATTRVAGHDRCDSAKTSRTPVCARVIESRAGDYVHPDPLLLSPEQRLLVDQRLRAGQSSGSPFTPRPSDADQADPATLQGQTVAAIVRGEDRPQDAKAVGALPSGVSADTLIVIDAILGQQTPK
jgi:hypothetical protein